MVCCTVLHYNFSNILLTLYEAKYKFHDITGVFVTCQPGHECPTSFGLCATRARNGHSFALQNNLKFVRMDTWADNKKIIDYYKSFGFEFIENYKTTNATELPIQNRNLNVALLEMELNEN
jgi:hypothetical protein